MIGLNNYMKVIPQVMETDENEDDEKKKKKKG